MAAGPTYTPIASTTLGSAAASITFSSISGSYTDLFLVFTGGTATSSMDVAYQVNGDTGSNYSSTYILNYGSSVSSGRESGATYATVGTLTERFGIGTLNFMSYSSSTTYKTAVGSNFGNTDYKTATSSTLWRSTAAITSISIINLQSRQFATGSTLALYGIKAA